MDILTPHDGITNEKICETQIEMLERKQNAGMAMQGMMADWKHHFDGFHISKAVQFISNLSVQVADALIAELKKDKGQ